MFTVIKISDSLASTNWQANCQALFEAASLEEAKSLREKFLSEREEELPYGNELGFSLFIVDEDWEIVG